MAKILCALLTLLTLTLSSATAAPVNNQGLKYNDPDKPILVKSDQKTFTITLAANPTTGYLWFLKKYDHELIKPVGYRYIAPKTQIPGKGGTAVWTFKATDKAFAAPTMTNITLVYAQPWALPASTERDFTVITTESAHED